MAQKIKPSRFSKKRKTYSKLHDFFYIDGNIQKPEFILVTLVLTAVVPILISAWGLKLTSDNSQNREQIGVLQKIYTTSENTSKSTQNLKELPNKLSILSSTLDTLNFSLSRETKKLEKSYSELNITYDQLIKQQKEYLDKINSTVELTNEQIRQLEKNNKLIHDEYLRRPKIKISSTLKVKDGKYYIDALYIENTGNIEAKIYKLTVDFDSYGCTCLDSLKWNAGWKHLTKNSYQFNSFWIPVQAKSDFMVDIINSCYYNSRKAKIKYQIIYESKYANESDEGEVSLK